MKLLQLLDSQAGMVKCLKKELSRLQICCTEFVPLTTVLNEGVEIGEATITF